MIFFAAISFETWKAPPYKNSYLLIIFTISSSGSSSSHSGSGSAFTLALRFLLCWKRNIELDIEMATT